MRKVIASVLVLIIMIALGWRFVFPPPVSVLILGGSKGHKTAQMAELIFSGLENRPFRFKYTEDLNTLSPEILQLYDVLIITSNQAQIETAQERALLEAVERGLGLVVVHSASHAFRNSSYYTELVGGRFDTHGTGIFRSRIIDANHPVMQGYNSFESWDETYIHKQLGNDLRVMMIREHEGGYEPYSWSRRQGKGKVFYTALGHDERTWIQPEFQDLIARAISWTAGRTREESDALLPGDYLSTPPPKPLTPEASMATMSLPEGFRVELFAAEPEVVNPLSITFDERGRLWVIESLDYPNRVEKTGRGRDRIKILEDRDGDGRADTSTIFAEGLNIPTSLLRINGGLLVAQAPQVLFLEDTDGDDVADRKTVILDGFGRWDTHAVLNNFRYGFDGWIWATIGYSRGQVQVGEKLHEIEPGVFRFRADGSELEVMTSTGSNTWGLGFNESGDAFISKANRLHHFYLAIPNRFYERVEGWAKLGRAAIEDHKAFHPITRHIRQVDAHGGYTSAAGKTVYTARGFPSHYWNRAALVSEPTGHLVHIDFSVPDGSSFVGKDGWNLLASQDPWSAPVETLVGPDGAVWVADWYNYIVRHNPTPPGFETGAGNAYVTDQRDKQHGRIYRIVHRDQTLDQAPATDITKTSSEVLVKGLRHSNLFWRQQCQRILLERGETNVIPALALLVGDHDMDDTGLTPGAVHGLLTMSSLGAFSPGSLKYRPMLETAFRHPSAAVRRTALKVTPRDILSRAQILSGSLLEDSNPQVRLQALLALSEMPISALLVKRVSAMMKQKINASDPWIPDAIISLVTLLPDPFLATFLSPNLDNSVAESLVPTITSVAKHLAGRTNTREIQSMFRRLPQSHPSLGTAVLRGVSQGWPRSHPMAIPSLQLERLADLVRELDPSVQADLIRIAKYIPRRHWGPKINTLISIFKRDQLVKLEDNNQPFALRLAAAQQLVLTDEGLDRILRLITSDADAFLAESLLLALSQSATRPIGRALISRWSNLPQTAKSAAVKVLLRRQDSLSELLDAVEEGRIEISDFSLDQRQFLLDNPGTRIARRAALLFEVKLSDGNREKLVASRTHVAKEPGDLEVGRLIFQDNCLQCHQLDGQGGQVGPSLTGVGARDRADILADILDPNRSVEGNYRQITVKMDNGVLYVGLMGAATETGFELIESDGTHYQIERSRVAQLTRSELSLMPEGFETLSDEDLSSLLDYLTQQRRFLPLPLRTVTNIVTTRGIVSDIPTDTAKTLDQLGSCCWISGNQTVSGVPFEIIDPQGGRARNAILLFSRLGTLSRERPKSVSLNVNGSIQSLHLLSGVSGWGYPLGKKGSVSMIVRFEYESGQSEEHVLENGIHFADYSRLVDVPKSQLAFRDGPLQMRYLAVHPHLDGELRSIEFIKGPDDSAPLILAATIERPLKRP